MKEYEEGHGKEVMMRRMRQKRINEEGEEEDV